MIAGLVAKDPKRYGMLACLPCAHIDASLKEVEFACDTLKTDGFCMLSNAGGTYIGDDRMDEILAELNKRSAAVLLHPTKAAGEIPSLLVTDLSTYEYPFEISRAMIDLIYRGKIQKYLKWIVSHAGMHAVFAIMKGLKDRLYPRSKSVMASLPTFLIALMLWLVSRIASMRELMATGLNECRLLADKMVAASDKAKPTQPSMVQAVLKMKPAEENRVTSR